MHKRGGTVGHEAKKGGRGIAIGKVPGEKDEKNYGKDSGINEKEVKAAD